MSDDRELTLADFPVHRQITTRWSDNDVFGHLNNAVYHLLFDTAVNTLLVEAGALDPQKGATVGFCVENGCSYFAPLAFPQALEAGVRAASVGGSRCTGLATPKVTVSSANTALVAL